MCIRDSPGSPASFSVTANGNPTPTYLWYHDNVLIPGANSSTYNISTVSAGDAGNYVVIASNSVGTAVSSPPAVLSLNGSPILTGPANQTVNQGQPVTFTTVANGTG